MAASGKREAWDSGLYWIGAYPLAILLAAWLGYEFPRRAWRWGLAIMLAQAATLAVTSLDFSMLPFGLIVFSLLALPLIGAAMLAAWLTRRSEERCLADRGDAPDPPPPVPRGRSPATRQTQLGRPRRREK